MNPVITFFRDTLDGTTYVIVCSVSAVLLCACIGYLAEKKSKNKTKNIENENPVELPSTNLQEQTVVPEQTPQPLETPQEKVSVNPTDNINENVAQQTQYQTQNEEIFPPVENQNFNSSPQVPTATPEQTNQNVQYQQQVPPTPQVNQNVTSQQTYTPPQNGEIFPPQENQIPNAQINQVMPPMEAASLETPQVPETLDKETTPQEEQPIEAIETTDTPQITQPQMPQAPSDQQPQIPTIQ